MDIQPSSPKRIKPSPCDHEEEGSYLTVRIILYIMSPVNFSMVTGSVMPQTGLQEGNCEPSNTRDKGSVSHCTLCSQSVTVLTLF